MKLYMFRTVPLSIIRTLFTVHSAMVYVIQICRQLSSRTRMVLLEVCTGFWWGSLREGDDWEDPNVDGRITLRRNFGKWEGVLGTGWSWLRIGTGGGHL